MPLSGVLSLLKQGLYRQADREAERLIAGGDLSPADQAEAYVLASVAKHHLQEFFAGAKLAERALHCPQARRDTLGMAYFMAGAHCAEIGDAHQAIAYNEQFMQYLDASPRCKAQEPRAHNNLAVAYRQRRDYTIAIGHYELAARIFEENDRTALAMECYRDVAWCYLVQGDPTGAVPFIGRLEAWVQQQQDDSARTALMVDKAMYAFSTGHFAEAVAFCEEIFAPGREDVSPNLITKACWIAGECALATERLQEAAIFANLTIDHALKAKWPFMMNRGNDLRRRVMESRQGSGTAS